MAKPFYIQLEDPFQPNQKREPFNKPTTKKQIKSNKKQAETDIDWI